MKKLWIYLVICACLCVPLHADSIRIALASKSNIKRSAVIGALERSIKDFDLNVECFSCPSGVPEQPMGIETAVTGARNRVNYLSQELSQAPDYLISIESTIQYIPAINEWNDIGVVMLIKDGNFANEKIVFSKSTPIPSVYVKQAMDHSPTGSVTDEGFPVTVGEAIKDSFMDREVQKNDWHAEKEFGGVSRKELLQEAVFKALHATEIDELKERVIYYPDFPKPGIVFADFFPLLADGASFEKCIDLLAQYYKGTEIDAVVGLESRGFLIGAALAVKLGVGFVPVRKPGKLPGSVHSVTYAKEYGTDTLTISQGALAGGKKVILVDDLIATGGSALAAAELVRMAGGDPIGFATLLEVKELDGRTKLGIPSFNLLD